MGSKNVPEKFQLCFVDVVCEGWLLCEEPCLLVGVCAGCGVEDLCVVGALEVKDFSQTL